MTNGLGNNKDMFYFITQVNKNILTDSLEVTHTQVFNN